MKTRPTALFLDSAKTGVIEFPLARIGEQKPRQEGHGVLRIGAKNAAQFGGFGSFRSVETGYAILRWAIRDIFVIRGTALFAAEQRISIARRNVHRRNGK
jgi:hypothetical protein